MNISRTVPNNLSNNQLYFSRKLEESFKKVFRFPLTVVVAPMGYGKTTASNELLQRSKVPFLWMNLYDNSPDAFWKRFCRLFSEIAPELAQCLENLGAPTDILSINESIELFRKYPLPSKVVVVVDDFHLITNEPVAKFFEIFAREAVTDIHIILTARFISIASLEELTLKKAIFQITKDDLRLSISDIINYFSLFGTNITEQEAKGFFELTEGWISALYLMRLDSQKKNVTSPVRDIFYLLKETIYDNFSDELKKFCSAVFMFDNPTRAQINYIWNKENSSLLLDEAVRKNAFISYDRQSDSFKVHKLFNELLQELSLENSPENAIYEKRAAEWFRKTEQFFSAMEIYFRCGEYERFIEIFYQVKENCSAPEQIKLLKQFFDVCPRELRVKHFPALIKFAWPMVFCGNTPYLIGLCDEIEEILDEVSKKNSPEISYHRGELELLRSLAVFNNLPKMSFHQYRAKKFMNHSSILFPENSRWAFGSPSVLYLYHNESGKLRENVDCLIENLSTYSSITNGHGSGGEYMIEAEFYFMQGNFDSARLSLKKAVNLASPVKEDAILFCALMLQIKLDLLDSNYESATQKLMQYRLNMALNKKYLYIHTLEICENTFYALLEQESKISSEFLETETSNLRMGFPAFGTFVILQCRYLMLKGQAPELLGRAIFLERISSVFPNVLGQIYAKIFSAAANLLVANKVEACAHLKAAIELAIPDQVLIPFVEYWGSLKDLAKNNSIFDTFNDFISKISKLYPRFKSARDKIVVAQFSSVTNKLSSRELQIARLAAQGKTNPQIGEILYISTNTVKMTLKRIYTKLSVNNRVFLKQILKGK